MISMTSNASWVAPYAEEKQNSDMGLQTFIPGYYSFHAFNFSDHHK